MLRYYRMKYLEIQSYFDELVVEGIQISYFFPLSLSLFPCFSFSLSLPLAHPVVQNCSCVPGDHHCSRDENYQHDTHPCDLGRVRGALRLFCGAAVLHPSNQSRRAVASLGIYRLWGPDQL